MSSLKQQWIEIHSILKSQLQFLECLRLIYPIAGEPADFTQAFLAKLRLDLAM